VGQANPNKPNFHPKTRPREAQNLPNLLSHNELRNHPESQKQTQTNPISAKNPLQNDRLQENSIRNPDVDPGKGANWQNS